MFTGMVYQVLHGAIPFALMFAVQQYTGKGSCTSSLVLLVLYVRNAAVRVPWVYRKYYVGKMVPFSVINYREIPLPASVRAMNTLRGAGMTTLSVCSAVAHLCRVSAGRSPVAMAAADADEAIGIAPFLVAQPLLSSSPLPSSPILRSTTLLACAG